MKDVMIKTAWLPIVVPFIGLPLIFAIGMIITWERAWPQVIGTIIIGIWTAAAIKYLRKG